MATNGDRPRRRPKDPIPRPHAQTVRFSDEEHELLSAACAATGQSVGAYMAAAVLQAATRDAGSEFTIRWPESWPPDLRVKHFDGGELSAQLAGLAIDVAAQLAPGESITITRNR